MATQETIKQMFSGGVLRDVEDVTARQMVAALQNAIDALTSGDTTTAIETFQEVIDFLNGVTDDATLVGKLNELRTLINEKQDVISDLSSIRSGAAAGASAVQPAQMQSAIEDAVKNMPTGDIPKNVSELNNDVGYQTQEQVAEAISQAAIEAVVGNGDFVMTYDQTTDTYNIVRLVPTISVSEDSLSFDSTAKEKTIIVSGHNLKADITIQAPAGWTVDKTTLAHTDGVVAETQVRLTYGGTESSAATGNLVLTSGSVSKNVPLSYTQYGGPTITVESASLSFEAIGGQSQTKTVTVGLFNITGDVTVEVTGANADKFSASLSGNTLSVTYTPGSINIGSHQATITLSASGAQSKTVAVSGTVLEQSLTITSNPSPLSLQSDNGVAATGTINVKGQNITGNVTLNVSGSGFTLSENSLAAADVNSANGVDVTVTANIASGDTASATISASSGLASASASAEWTKTEADPEVDDVKVRNGLYYKVTSVADGDTHGTVKLVTTKGDESYANAQNYAYKIANVVIPAEITIANKQYDVTAIGQYVFYNNTSIRSLDLSGATHLKTLGYCAFFNVTNLSGDVVCPDSITTYGNACLANSAINKCTIGNGASYTKWEDYTKMSLIFANTKTDNRQYPKIVDCGTGITAVGHWQLGAAGITTMILRCANVASIVTEVTSAASLEHVYVPANLVASYKANSAWANYVNIIEAIPNELL